MPVTQSEIARLAGVDRSAVSRVLRGQADAIGLSDAKTREILSLATELGYRPNAAVRAMQTGRFGTAALLSSTTDALLSYTPPQLLNATRDALAAAGLRLLIEALGHDELTGGDVLPVVMREWMCDGLLINYHFRFPPQIEAALSRHRIPAVWVNSPHESDCVYLDDRGGARALAEYLLRHGHRRIAYLDLSHNPDDPDPHYSVPGRLLGYRDAMAGAGLHPSVTQLRASGPAQASAARRALLGGDDRPTAVICYGDPTPLAIDALELGLRVPADLSVAGFAERPLHIGGRAVTLASLPFARLGRTAAETLALKVDGADRITPPKVIDCTLIEGATTAAPYNRSGTAA